MFFFILKKVLPFLSGDAAMKAEEALDLLNSFSSDFDTKMWRSLYLFYYLFYWDKESFLSQWTENFIRSKHNKSLAWNVQGIKDLIDPHDGTEGTQLWITLQELLA